jgi:hypothetical protein
MTKQKNQPKQIKKEETIQPTLHEQESKQNLELEKNEMRSRFEERQPTMDRKITLSRDTKWLIIKTIRTDIVHVNYMEKIMQSGEAQ